MEHPMKQSNPGASITDPICGMSVSEETPFTVKRDGKAWYFCSNSCQQRFLSSAKEQPKSASTNSKWTCPMHPEIVRNESGDCPKCGMALEPMAGANSEDENPELTSMTYRFWGSVVLTLPILVLSMGSMIPGNPIGHVISPRAQSWAELLLATPVVFWGAWVRCGERGPVLQRA